MENKIRLILKTNEKDKNDPFFTSKQMFKNLMTLIPDSKNSKNIKNSKNGNIYCFTSGNENDRIRSLKQKIESLRKEKEEIVINCTKSLNELKLFSDCLQNHKINKRQRSANLKKCLMIQNEHNENINFPLIQEKKKNSKLTKQKLILTNTFKEVPKRDLTKSCKLTESRNETKRNNNFFKSQKFSTFREHLTRSKINNKSKSPSKKKSVEINNSFSSFKYDVIPIPKVTRPYQQRKSLFYKDSSHFKNFFHVEKKRNAYDKFIYKVLKNKKIKNFILNAAKKKDKEKEKEKEDNDIQNGDNENNFFSTRGLVSVSQKKKDDFESLRENRYKYKTLYVKNKDII